MKILDVLNIKVPGGRRLGDFYKVQKTISPLVRGQKRLSRPFKNGRYVDIGCGPNMQPDWYNVVWRPGVDLCWDVERGLPFPDGSVSGYFSEHCFEHIELDSFLFVAKEMHRTMKDGAWARIVVPDAQIYCESYMEFLSSGTLRMPYTDGDVTRVGADVYSPIFSLNRIMRDHGHLFIYDFAIMEKYCDAPCSVL